MLKDKKKILIIGVIICLISLGYNIINIQRHRIDEPVVLEHYLEVPLQNQFELRIHYITNKRDNVKINRIYFPEYDFTFYNRGYEDKDELKYYNANTCIMNIRLTIDQQEEYENMKEIILEEAEITYNNGLMQKIDIGKIILNNEKAKGLDMKMSSSSNTGFSKTVFEFKNSSIVINNITSKFYEETQDFVKMNLVTKDELGNTIFNTSKGNTQDKTQKTEKDYEDDQEEIECYRVDEMKLPFKANEMLKANTIFKMLDNDCKYNVYDIRYVLHFLYENGNEGRQNLYDIKYSPYFTDKLVREIVKKRG